MLTPSRKLPIPNKNITATLVTNEGDVMIEKGKWVVINHDTGSIVGMSGNEIFDLLSEPAKRRTDPSKRKKQSKPRVVETKESTLGANGTPVRRIVVLIVRAMSEACKQNGTGIAFRKNIYKHLSHNDYTSSDRRMSEIVSAGYLDVVSKKDVSPIQYRMTPKGFALIEEYKEVDL